MNSTGRSMEDGLTEMSPLVITSVSLESVESLESPESFESVESTESRSPLPEVSSSLTSAVRQPANTASAASVETTRSEEESTLGASNKEKRVMVNQRGSYYAPSRDDFRQFPTSATWYTDGFVLLL